MVVSECIPKEVSGLTIEDAQVERPRHQHLPDDSGMGVENESDSEEMPEGDVFESYEAVGNGHPEREDGCRIAGSEVGTTVCGNFKNSSKQ